MPFSCNLKGFADQKKAYSGTTTLQGIQRAQIRAHLRGQKREREQEKDREAEVRCVNKL